MSADTRATDFWRFSVTPAPMRTMCAERCWRVWRSPARWPGSTSRRKRRFGVGISVRVGVHRGLVYLDTANGDVYGLAVNVAARVSGLAPPGSVVVSDAVESLVRGRFELQARPAAAVKGVDGLIAHHQVIGERAEPMRVARGPLVGRDHELAHLEKCWVRAQAGTLATPGVVFRGEPGIGKSRLAAAAAELVEECWGCGVGVGGVTVSHRRRPAPGSHPDRAPLRHQSRHRPEERLGLLDAEVRARSLDPETTVPLLAPVLGIGAEAGYEPVPAEGRKLYELIAEAVQRYLLACLGDGAGLVVAEDVHWFDPSTLEVLASLLDAGEGRLLVVLTGRPGGWLPAEWPVTVFDLKPLSDRQTDALITALNPAVTADERAAIAEPLRRGAVLHRTSRGRTSPRPACPRRCMSRCSPGCAPAPTWCRCWRPPPSSAARWIAGCCAAVVDLSDDEVDDVIDELEDALVLEPWGTDNWRFRHELLREVAAELAPPSVRTRLHAKVADALVGCGRRSRLAAGGGSLRAGRAIRRGGLGVPAGRKRCAASRRPGRGARPT